MADRNPRPACPAYGTPQKTPEKTRDQGFSYEIGRENRPENYPKTRRETRSKTRRERARVATSEAERAAARCRAQGAVAALHFETGRCAAGRLCRVCAKRADLFTAGCTAHEIPAGQPCPACFVITNESYLRGEGVAAA